MNGAGVGNVQSPRSFLFSPGLNLGVMAGSPFADVAESLATSVVEDAEKSQSLFVNSPFFMACKNGDIQKIKGFLQRNTDVRQSGDKLVRSTCFHAACSANNYQEVLSLLIAYYARYLYFKNDNSGNNPFLMENGSGVSVYQILSQKDDPKIHSKVGMKAKEVVNTAFDNDGTDDQQGIASLIESWAMTHPDGAIIATRPKKSVVGFKI